MTLTIKRRLQLYFVCFALLLLLTMALMMNHRLQSDFHHYLNEEKHQSLDALAERISQTYGSNPKKWQEFINQPNLFAQVVDGAFSQFSSQDLQPPSFPKPYTKPHHTHKPDLPPNLQHGQPHKFPKKPPNQQPPKNRPPNIFPSNLHLDIPVALLNTTGQAIHGQFIGDAENHFFSPVKDANGKTIAHFTLPKNTSFSSIQQQAYLSSFKRTLLMILVLSVLLSFLVAHFLANAFTQPIARLNHAVKALRNRKFDTHLLIRSQDEFGQLSQAFNQMIDKLAEYEAQQRKWLGNISHDLRTPVAVLKGEIDAVQDGIRQPTSETFDSLSQEIDSLSMMLDHFHQVAMQDIQQNSKSDSKKNSKPARPLSEQTPSKSETPDSEKQAITDKYMAENGIDPKPLLQQLAKRSEHSVNDTGLILKTDWHNTTAHIAMTELALTQIWQNLMQNSLRYTDAVRQDEYGQDAGQIVINTKVKKRQFILTWQDSAPSVPTELLDKLTEPLFRVEKSRNRAFAGSGLGLSIVKDIINQADGELHISQSKLGGLQVRVVLPLV